MSSRNRTAIGVALFGAADGRSPSPTPLWYDPELEVLVQWFPLDLRLPALADVPDLDRAEVLGYAPGRRAVLRRDDRVLRVYADRDRFERARAGAEIVGRLRSIVTPKVEGTSPEHRLLIQSFVDGRAPAAADVAAGAGALLASLHRSRSAALPSVGPLDHLDRAASAVEVVAAVAPSLRARARAMLAALEDALPDNPRGVIAHGAFHAGELLREDDRLAVVDFDDVCRAPAALDLATFAGAVACGDERDVDAVGEVLDRVVAGYDRRPRALDWFVTAAVLARSHTRFRSLEEDWPERTEGMVAAAGRLLAIGTARRS